MTDTKIDHAAEAERVIAEGKRAAGKATVHAEAGDSATADAYGSKAHGCWMQAQAEAALALVEQQRIANLIALGLGASSPQIREGLGLS